MTATFFSCLPFAISPNNPAYGMCQLLHWHHHDMILGGAERTLPFATFGGGAAGRGSPPPGGGGGGGGPPIMGGGGGGGGGGGIVVWMIVRYSYTRRTL